MQKITLSNVNYCLETAKRQEKSVNLSRFTINFAKMFKKAKFNKKANLDARLFLTFLKI